MATSSNPNLTSNPFPSSVDVSGEGGDRPLGKPSIDASRSETQRTETQRNDAQRSEAQRSEEARRLSERVAQGAHTLVDRIAPTVDRLKTQVTDATTALHRSADQLGEIQDKWISDSRASVRSHPLTWVAAAFVAGMVIGRMRSDS